VVSDPWARQSSILTGCPALSLACRTSACLELQPGHTKDAQDRAEEVAYYSLYETVHHEFLKRGQLTAPGMLKLLIQRTHQ